MTENTKPQPGSPEYDAAMIAKAETSGASASHTDANGNRVDLGAPPPAPSNDKPADEKPARPDDVPEKFWDAEKGEVRWADMAKAYRELESKLGKPKDETPPKDGEQPPKDGETPPEQSPALQALSEKATQELSEGGKLTDETYAGFEKAGISRAQLDAYVAGVEAIGKVRVMEAHAEVGGKDTYTAMQTWANTALTPAEHDAFNNALFGQDDGARLNAIRGLKARFEAENGRAGNLVKPRASSETLTGEVFRSRNEMTAAMKDARYKTDSAYRADVERKVANSANAGIDLW